MQKPRRNLSLLPATLDYLDKRAAALGWTPGQVVDQIVRDDQERAEKPAKISPKNQQPK